MYKLRTFIGKKGFIDAKCLTFEPTVCSDINVFTRQN